MEESTTSAGAAPKSSSYNPLYRFALLQFYLQQQSLSVTLLTQKELDDWAKDNNYDQQKVRMVNQALLKEGFIKSRKLNPSSTAPTNSYYWLGSKREELKAKLEKTLE